VSGRSFARALRSFVQSFRSFLPPPFWFFAWALRSFVQSFRSFVPPPVRSFVLPPFRSFARALRSSVQSFRSLQPFVQSFVRSLQPLSKARSIPDFFPLCYNYFRSGTSYWLHQDLYRIRSTQDSEMKNPEDSESVTFSLL